jgi:HSP20 family molecular chaperone IbpA
MEHLPQWQRPWRTGHDLTTSSREQPPLVRTSLPGVQPGEVKLSVQGNVLTVEGEQADSGSDRQPTIIEGEKVEHEEVESPKRKARL